MPRFLRFLSVVIFAAAGAMRLPADPSAMIAKARAYLGPEPALKAITSIHYTGTLESQETVKDKDGKEVTRPTKATVDIIFERPYRQRFLVVSDKKTEITVLDDYEAWYRSQQTDNASHWNFMLLNKDQIKYLRASTWENLAFYQGLVRRGGKVEDLGPVSLDGRACEKLAFVHEAGIAYYRYFDRATGQLLLTELESGNRIRQEGEIVVDGVRFPKRLIQVTKNPATGREQTAVITVDKVTLNETFPDSLFAVPMLIPPASPAPAAPALSAK